MKSDKSREMLWAANYGLVEHIKPEQKQKLDIILPIKVN